MGTNKSRTILEETMHYDICISQRERQLLMTLIDREQERLFDHLGGNLSVDEAETATRTHDELIELGNLLKELNPWD